MLDPEKRYLEWAERYAATFGFNTDADLRTLKAWKEVFEAAGYSGAELEGARVHIAANPQSLAGEERFAGKAAAHLSAIHRFIRAGRAVEYQRQVDEHESERGTCSLCGGSGRVVVPHPKGIRDGHWVPMKIARGGASFYTAAVLCSCPLGRWVGMRQSGDRQMMGLDAYERNNPRWREQMLAREQGHVAESGLVPADPAFAGALGRLLKRLGDENG